MVICKFFLQGTCKFGDSCKFEHQINDHNYGGNSSILLQNYQPKPQTTSNVDTNTLVKAVINDMTAAEKGGQWLLSSYAPFKEKPAFPGFEDHSMEEVRYLFYEAVKSGSIEQYKQTLQTMLQQAMMKIKALQNPSMEAVNMLKTIYDTPASSSVNSTPFASSTQNTVFGGPQQSVFANTNTSQNVFGGGNQQGVFSGTTKSSIFGGNQQSSMFRQQPSNTKSIFGGAQQPASGGSVFGGGTATSVFSTQQQSIFGQPPPNSSPFAQSAPQQPPNSSPFAQSVPPNSSPFAQSAPPNSSPFAQSAPPNSSPFAQSAPQQTQNSSPFAQSAPQQTQNSSPFAQSAPQQTQNSSPFAQSAPQQPPNSSPFAQSAPQPQFPQQSLFQQPTSPQSQFETKPNPPFSNSGPFGAQTQNTFATTQNTVAPITQTTKPASAFQHTQNIFGNMGTQPGNVFGNVPQNKPNPEFYSRLEDLTEEEIKWFQSDDLDISKIPEKPPTYEMCFKTQ